MLKINALKIKQSISVILAVFLMLFSAVPTAFAAVDNSQKYTFKLTANGAEGTQAAEAGQDLDIVVTLSRNDLSGADRFKMYSVQYDLLFNSRYFELDSSSLKSDNTKLTVSDMSQTGRWKGYKKISASAVSVNGADWNNGCTVLKCTLRPNMIGKTSLVPYTSDVSTSTGMDFYASDAPELSVTVLTPEDPDDNDNNGDQGNGSDGANGNTGGNGNYDPGNSGSDTNGGTSGNAGNSGNTAQGSGSNAGNSGSDVSSPDTALKFTDMTSHWSREYVAYAVGKGYFSGMTDTLFAPDESMSRGMLVTVLWRMDGSPAYDFTGQDTDHVAGFTDVSSGDWYAQAVKWAADRNIVNGTGKNSFSPKNAVTREQLVKIIRSFAGYKGKDVSGSADVAGFTDASTVSDWAQEAVKWGVFSGIISGTGNNMLSPKGVATRAQVAKILTMLDENILNK